MHRAVGPFLAAAAAAALALGFRLTHLPAQTQSAAPTTRPANLPSQTAMPTRGTVRSPEGDTLWRQSLRAAGPQGIPIKAHVTIRRSSGSDSDRTEFDLWDGGGKYRLAYTAPQNIRGRIVVCDGAALWQYEPLRGTVLRRTVPPNNTASPLEETALPAGMIAQVEGSPVTVSGRPAQVLTLQDGKGRLVVRRWLDEATKRSLRSETYDPQTGKRLTQVLLDNLQPLDNPAPDLFKPNFPQTARILKANGSPPSDLKAAVRSTGLPLTAGTYSLRSVRPGSRIPGAEEANHLIYSNGIETISVFVSIKPVQVTSLRPNARWQAVTITPTTAGFAHIDRQGRTAIAWIRSGKRCVAVSRLPQSELVSLIRGLTDSK